MRLNLHQKCVYWARSGNTAFGKPSYADPVELSCRWEDGTFETIDSKGDTVVSGAKVFLAESIAPQGVMLRGTLEDIQASGFDDEDPLANQGVHEIINAGNVPALKRSQSLTTVMLR
jgi:hypothetical protein